MLFKNFKFLYGFRFEILNTLEDTTIIQYSVREPRIRLEDKTGDVWDSPTNWELPRRHYGFESNRWYFIFLNLIILKFQSPIVFYDFNNPLSPKLILWQTLAQNPKAVITLVIFILDGPHSYSDVDDIMTLSFDVGDELLVTTLRCCHLYFVFMAGLYGIARMRTNCWRSTAAILITDFGLKSWWHSLVCLTKSFVWEIIKS